MTQTDQRPQECEHYRNGRCYIDNPEPPHLCCMRIIKPVAECFYFIPKTEKEC